MLSLRLAKYPIIILMAVLVANLLILTKFPTYRWLLISILTPIDLIIVHQALILFGTVPYKRRAIRRLVASNRKQFRAEKFAEYMNAPCSRQVAKIALETLGETHRFAGIKDAYQKSFFAARKTKRVRITFVSGDKTTITEL